MLARRIATLGGGGFLMEPRNRRLDSWLLGLAGRSDPRVLFIATASGDARHHIAKFYRAFGKLRCQPTHLPLFQRTTMNLRQQILESDLIYVGGGNTMNMLALWRLHGVDVALRDAWKKGIVLCGVSAGAICWYDAGVTDSFGPELQPLPRGLAFLRGSFCPHYNSDVARRPAFKRFIRERRIPSGYAADDGAAILFENDQLADVVSSRPDASAYRLSRRGDQVREEKLPARFLPK